MDTLNINILAIVGSTFCIEAEEGEKVYELVKKAITEKKKVELSFLNIELLTTAFLNSAVGKLYGDFSEEEIRAFLSVKDISRSSAASLKRVIETAKLYFKNPQELEDSINKILEE